MAIQRPTAQRTGPEITWCPGCGNFGVLNAVREALRALRLPPERFCVVAGIGQSGRLCHHLGTNYLHGLHGRVLPCALGVKLANHSLEVIAIGGDGDMYGEGGNHLLNAFRRNLDIACLVHNNGVYGLTKGQASPTSGIGSVAKGASSPTVVPPFNPLTAALVCDATFVARGFAGDIRHLGWLVAEAMRHPGFGFVDILQPCVTYNKVNTFAFYRERVYDLAQAGHNPADRQQAWRRAREWPEHDGRIPLGIFYREERPVYGSSYPALKERPLIEQSLSVADWQRLREEFR